jgi:hypothetical protein
MPRYYFYIGDGKRIFTDATGVELTGLAAARAHVIVQIRDIKGAQSERGVQDWSGWSVTVVDEKTKKIFEMDFNLKPKPAD